MLVTCNSSRSNWRHSCCTYPGQEGVTMRTDLCADVGHLLRHIAHGDDTTGYNEATLRNVI